MPSLATVPAYLTGTFPSDMTQLTTLLALTLPGHLTLLITVTCPMPILRAHSARDSLDLLLHFLLRTLVAPMSERITVAALWDHPIHHDPSFGKTLHVLLRSLWPASIFRELLAAWLSAELDRHHIGLVDLALQVDDGVGIRDFLLLGDEIGVHIGVTEHCLYLWECDFRIGFDVGEDGLQSN